MTDSRPRRRAALTGALFACAALGLGCVTPRREPATERAAEPAPLPEQQPTALDLSPRELPPPLAIESDADDGALDGTGASSSAVHRERSSEGATPAYGAINLIFGDRTLDDLDDQFGEDLELIGIDLATQKVFGLEGVVLPLPRLPFGIEAGALVASEDDSAAVPAPLQSLLGPSADFELETVETYLGLRLFLHRALPGGFPLEPFVAVGLARVFYDVRLTNEALGQLSAGDGTGGHYLRLGVQGRVHRRVHVGLEVRWLEGADATLALGPLPSLDVDFDHRQVAVFIGLRL